MIEMILVPIVFLLHFFAFEPVYILGSSGGIVFIWWATAVISLKNKKRKWFFFEATNCC